MQAIRAGGQQVVSIERSMTTDPGQTTVTQVATTYGFYHPGRFSRWYRENFGERPSEILKRPG